MKSKRKVESKNVFIKVNDIFDELSEENKRLNEELMFANNCLNVLNKFKSLLNKICVKFETIIDSEDKQELNQLEDEFNSFIKSKEQINETNVKEINGNIEENCNQLNEDLSKNKEKTQRNLNNECNV